MSDWLRSADLVALFEQELRLCRVQAGESVLIFTDPRFPHPEYPPAALAAARCLGANAYILVSQGDQGFDDPLVRAAWCHADMVLGMSMLPSGIGKMDLSLPARKMRILGSNSPRTHSASPWYSPISVPCLTDENSVLTNTSPSSGLRSS